MELWLDHSVAPELHTRTPKDDAALVRQMIDALNKTADAMEKSLRDTTASLEQTLENSKTHLVAFHQTVEKFNNGVHDFAEVDYNLRGTVERMDLAIRDLTGILRQGLSRERGGDK